MQGFAQKSGLGTLAGIVKGDGAGNYSAATLGADYIDTTYVRELLTANRTYYVRTDGDNGNTGLVNSAGGAFLTIQHACDVVTGTLDLGNFNVTIQVGNGTYTAGANLSGYIGGTGVVTIQGDTTTPANCIVAVATAGGTGGQCFYGRTFGGLWQIRGFRMTTTGSGTNCIRSDGGSRVLVFEAEFGPAVNAHMLATQNGGFIQPSADYIINGGGQRHAIAQLFSQVGWVAGITITLTGTPAFSSQFVNGSASGVINASGATTFSGAATGQRYNGTVLGNILTAGGGANYFPGSVAGTVATGAIYT